MSTSSLIVTCHPLRTSFCGRVAELITETIAGRGDDVIVDDLARAGFNPTITSSEFETFYEDRVPEDAATLVAHLRAARELVFVLPIWMYGMPSILKGYFERVWRPHVAYRLDGDSVGPLLVQITRMTVVVTHGRSEEETSLVGDATVKFFSTSLLSLLPNLNENTRFDFYALDAPDAASIERDLEAVRLHFRR